MTKLYRSPSHFPYRQYGARPLVRRYRWRMNHDAWCMVMVVAMIAVFVALEVWR